MTPQPQNEIDGDAARNSPPMPSDWMTSFIFPEGDSTRQTKPKNRRSKDYRKTEILNRLQVSGKSVIDIGCSEGIYSFYLAMNGADVSGIDISPERIERAKFACKRLGFDNARFEVSGNLNEISSNKYDLSVAYGFLHRISDPINFILDMGRISDSVALEWRAPALLPGGRLGLGVHNPFGFMEWKNIESHEHYEWSNEKAYRRDGGGLADFWRASPSVVISLLERINFK